MENILVNAKVLYDRNLSVNKSSDKELHNRQTYDLYDSIQMDKEPYVTLCHRSFHCNPSPRWASSTMVKDTSGRHLVLFVKSHRVKYFYSSQ